MNDTLQNNLTEYNIKEVIHVTDDLSICYATRPNETELLVAKYTKGKISNLGASDTRDLQEYGMLGTIANV